MKLHPLINPDSSHYDDPNGLTAIEMLEEVLTVQEMIGYCKGNIFKYEYRKHKKGQTASDIQKIKTYVKYLDVLFPLLDYTNMVSVKKAFENSGLKFKYKVYQ